MSSSYDQTIIDNNDNLINKDNKSDADKLNYILFKLGEMLKEY
jgi:hypothetical protein